MRPVFASGMKEQEGGVVVVGPVRLARVERGTAETLGNARRIRLRGERIAGGSTAVVWTVGWPIQPKAFLDVPLGCRGGVAGERTGAVVVAVVRDVGLAKQTHPKTSRNVPLECGVRFDGERTRWRLWRRKTKVEEWDQREAVLASQERVK